MSIPFDTLLAHFKGVRRLSDKQAVARCPAHNDRSPSLSLTETTSPEGKRILEGDVDFETVKEKAKAITPVPGGVGPMTITMLMMNTVRAAKVAAGLS